MTEIRAEQSDAHHLEIGQQGNSLEDLRFMADYLRKDAFEVIRSAQNGHIGGSSSSVELLTALYFGGQFNFALDDPGNPERDRVLIRGHEGPIRYPIFSLLGYIDREELWTYRQLGSRLQGHEDMHETPGVDITPSGSLGMLLSYGVGSAIIANSQGRENRTIVFLGDGEEQEGNVSEAARHAASLDLNNLICVIDKNSKQLSRPTSFSDSGTDIKQIWQGYGWDVLEIADGHDLEEITNTYEKLSTIKKPTVVIAHTVKGFGVEGSEDHFSGYHTLSAMQDKGLLDESIKRLERKLGERADSRANHLARILISEPKNPDHNLGSVDGSLFDIRYHESGSKNMEDGQSEYFAQLRERVTKEPVTTPLYVMTPDLLRSDIVEQIGMNDFTERYLDTGLREQHTIAMAHGISVCDPSARVYVCYGDAFLFRAADQMNAAATGGSSMLVAGENAGIFQGQNGKTHQSIGQPGALMQIPEATVLEPADVHDLFNVFSNALCDNSGFTYVRLHRGNMNILERDSEDDLNTDAYHVYRPDGKVELVLAASGFMVENAVAAAKELEVEEGISTTVVNVVNQKTLDTSLPKLIETDAPIVTIYNGNPYTLHANVSSAIMGNPDMPRPKYVAAHGFTGGTSGSVADLIRYYKFDTPGIKEVALSSLTKYGGRLK